MLTGDLLRTRVRKKIVSPSFVDPSSPKGLERAAQLMALFQRAEESGLRRADLDQSLRDLSSLEVEHKLLKGLAKVLLDRSDFVSPVLDVEGPPTAQQVRMAVFRLAADRAGRGSAGQLIDRTAVLEEAAESIGCSAQEVEDFLYADRKDMQRLRGVKGFGSPGLLLHRYNLALCQSVLLHATGVRIRLSEPGPKWLRLLFRSVKFHRLMYSAKRLDGGVELLLDGPQSLFKQSTRYGMQLAVFLPSLLLLPGIWELEADLLWGKKRKTRKIFRLDSGEGIISHYRATGVWRSRTELWFEQRFLEKDRGWSLSPGELVFQDGQNLLLPDFTFRKGSRIAHMEIVGFWRKGRLENLLETSPSNLVLAVSKNLCGDKKALPAGLANRILAFAEAIPPGKVVGLLERIASIDDGSS
jgi:uncharacterized protein